MRKLVIGAAAVLVAAAVALRMTAPPPPAPASQVFDPALLATTVPGAWHVHSRVSDGAASREEIAAAAARAGLRFVVFTDHGDGTRPAVPPVYMRGVLCIDAVEISTNGGHYIALDMRQAAYPLGGEAPAVIEDVRRLGGFGVVAHPYSAKADLRWNGWDAPFDGIEWLNADSEWRNEALLGLIRLPFDYLLRPGPALVSTFDRPVAALDRWDTITPRRPLVGLAAHDAHGSFTGTEEGGRVRLSGFPSYQASFTSFSLRAIVSSALTGSAADDARLVLDAIRRGRIFSAIDAIARPAQLEFTAAAGPTEAMMGDALPFDSAIELVVRSTLPGGGLLVLLCDGRPVGESLSGELRIRPQAPTACRPEVRAPQAPGEPPVPWIVGNPIYLLSAVTEPIGSEPLFESTLTLDHLEWTVEQDPGSQAMLRPGRGAFTLEYLLADGGRRNQYVAAAAPLRPPVPPFDQILFTAESASPMRVSVQLRLHAGERWTHSVYVEPDARRVVVPTASLVRAGGPAEERPDFRNASTLLFVVDLVNARPGSSGILRVSDLAFGRMVQ